MHRRRLLSVLAGGSGSVLAGCTAVLGDDAVELLGVSITNMDDERRTVDVRLERDGEIIEDSTYDMDANHGWALECT